MHLINCAEVDDTWRRPMAERLRIIASQIEQGNVSDIVILSAADGQWTQDLYYTDQYATVGALEHVKLALMTGRI